MVSASKAAREAKRAAEGKAPKKTVASRSKVNSKNASGASSVAGDETPPLLDGDGNPVPDDDQPATSAKKMDEVKRLADQMDKHGLSDRVTTGVLSSLKQSRDVKITSVSLVFHGRVLISDTTLELTYGRRYGLLGENGCGKSTLLKAIDKREYPIPDHVDIYLLNEGAPPSDLGALEWVVREAENEMERLDKQAEQILEEDGPESPLLMDLYEVCFHFTFFVLWGQAPKPPASLRSRREKNGLHGSGPRRASGASSMTILNSLCSDVQC
jgi:ATP-binding cassette subfamily F protein 2